MAENSETAVSSLLRLLCFGLKGVTSPFSSRQRDVTQFVKVLLEERKSAREE